MIRAEYIWLDGTKPTARLRSKIKVVTGDASVAFYDATTYPEWNFDGSSTNQATGGNSDVKLVPVFACKSPFAHSDALVLCECFSHDGIPLESNTRSKLSALGPISVWLGFEQEYVICDPETRLPLGFKTATYPGPQGPYYCGVGGDVALGREVSDEHLEKCLQVGLMIYGTNAEVLPGQWEFQIGLRDRWDQNPNALKMADHLIVARYILSRVAEEHGYYISLDCKPVLGDWNGSGMHTNISTKESREAGGYDYILSKMPAFEAKHKEHIVVYGHGLEARLTGAHETCSINEFRYGIADRGCSIRIPTKVAIEGSGYFEDRRPGANADPYLVAWRILETLSGS